MMRHEQYMKQRMQALSPDEEQLIDAFYADRADMVNNPPHYNQAGIECIDAIKAALGEDGFKAYCHGNIQKYLWRHPYKNGLEDLKKAHWYLDKLIKEYEK